MLLLKKQNYAILVLAVFTMKTGVNGVHVLELHAEQEELSSEPEEQQVLYALHQQMLQDMRQGLAIQDLAV